jgi:hypothetical protein
VASGTGPARDDPHVPSDLRLDPAGVASAAARASLLADDLEALARRAAETIGLTDLPDALAAAQALLRDSAVVLRRTAEGVAEADAAAARRLGDLHR